MALTIVLIAAVWSAAAQAPGVPPMAVGVRYSAPADGEARRRDLEDLLRLRFNVVAPTDTSIVEIDRLLAGAVSAATVQGTLETIKVSGASPDALVLAGWRAVGRGRKTIVFDGWQTLTRDAAALKAASAFADAITRNAALYAPLAPADRKHLVQRMVVDGGPGAIEAYALESADATVLVLLNVRRAPVTATITFTPETPEAIWQNMVGGEAVNFVAGPKGPVYRHRFPPHDVVVLMIRKHLR